MWRRVLSGLFIWLLAVGPAAAGCIGDMLDGGPPVAWDRRDGVARQIETDGAALGLPARQVARLALALRLGRDGAAALAPGDRAVLAVFDTPCPRPTPKADSPERPFGFDWHLGWPELLASSGLSAFALGGLIAVARLRAVMRRKRKRYFCSIMASCADGAQQHPCRVEDVSLNGARLRFNRRLAWPIGQRVDLDLRGMVVQGKVAWQNRHFTGVDFDRPLTRAELLHLVRPEKYPRPPP